MVEYRAAETLDAVFAALSHPVRRDVLDRLRSGRTTVGELAAPFDMSLAAVSKHIRVLEECGLLTRAVNGRRHELALEASPLLRAEVWVGSYRRFWESRLDALEAGLTRARGS